MAILPGGIPTATAFGSTKSNGCIRSWLPWNWRTLQFLISSTGAIASSVALGTPQTRIIFRNVGHIVSVQVLGNVTLYEAGSDNWLYIANADRLIDWSKAGVWDTRYNTKGIPYYPVSIDLTGLGSYGGNPIDPTGTVSSSAAINKALSDCSDYHAVFLPPGTYLLTSISIPSYKVLRGSGPFVTIILQDPSSMAHCINLSGSYSYGTTANIVGAGVKGSDTVIVSSTANFAVGDLVLVDQLNDPAFVTIVGSEDTCYYCSRSNGTRALGETKIIKAVGANTLQFERPLYYGYSSTFTAQVVRLASATNTRTNAGVESLSLHMASTINSGWDVDQGNGIHFEAAKYCWAKDVETYNHPRTHLRFRWYCVGGELRHSYLHDTWPGYSASGSYAVSISNHSTDCLIEDNILVHAHSQCVIGSAGGTANVIAYNFFENGRYDGSKSWWLAGTGTHGAHTYMNLWEGNLNQKITHDNIHGSGSHQFWFRNRVTGYPYNLDAVKTGELSVVNIPYENPYISLVGNILGTDGYDTIYEAYPCSTSAKQIYKLGTDGTGSTGGQHDPNDVTPTILRHGNYDYVTHSIVWDPAISGRGFPASLYLTAKPAFFGSLAWPAFGPDLIPMVGTIPAKVRYDAGTYF